MTTTIGPLVVASDLGDAASGDVGVDIQAYSAKLNAIAVASWADNKILLLHADGSVTVIDATTFGQSVIAAANAAALRTLIGAASDTATGVVELATTAETTTGTDTVRAVTPAGVKAAIDALIGGAPGALDTLNELAAAINDDASFAASITTALAGKADASSKLSAVAGMTWAADKGFYSTSSSAVSTFDLTSFARTILDDTNAAGVLSTLGITGAIIPGTADSVAAMGLITPATSGTNGITWKAGSSTWGQAGWSAAAGDAAYGTEQVWSYHKYGTGSATDLLLARLDAAGGIGATALHIATGRNAPSWWSAPTQCAWINPYVDTTGLVISAPTTTNSATWASNFISCTSGRSGSQLELFGVGSSGLISSADGLNAGTNVTARYGLSTQAYIGNVFGVAGLGLGSSVDTYVARIAAGIVGIGNALQLPEMTPPAGSADTARICARDLSGVTQAVVVLPDSSVAPIANALRVANNQTGTTYTLAMTDFGEVVEANNASAVTVTIPANASVAFPVGTVIRVYQMGAGQVTVAAAGGVTLRAPAGAKTVAQYATIELWKRATNEWTVAGQTTT